MNGFFRRFSTIDVETPEGVYNPQKLKLLCDVTHLEAPV